MENGHNLDPAKQTNTEDLPTLLKKLASREVPGFDYDEDKRGMTMQRPALRMRMQGTADGHAHTAEFIHSDVQGTDAEATKSQANVIQSPETVVSFKQSRRNQSVSISMPTSPSVLHMETAKRVQIVDEAEQNAAHGQVAYGPAKGCANNPQRSKQMFHSQPMSAGTALGKSIPRGTAPDRRFNSFKTWSGKLERQISNLRGKQQPTEPEPDGSVHAEPEGALSVDRYYDALQGPELDILKPSEEAALPEDKQWPFLLRFPISSFGICLGVSSQAILWKTLATSPSTEFLRVSPSVNVTLWCASLVLMSCVSSVYALKIIFYFEAVRREYYHPIRVNFFFAPWIACLFLSIGVPPSVSRNLPAALWYVLMAPILCLELKIYGQWMSGGQRRLSKVANPSNHLSIVGNFVGALLGASMGLKEGPIFFFAVGLAHYTVLFVTLYQRLPTNETLPKELHPVFFLFVAAPSVACMAWAKINGDFNYGSRVAYFIALFLYASLAVRINFFRGFRFSLAWWAYTFPMTGAAIATIGYSTEVKNPLTQALSIALSAISTFTVTALLVSTIIHAFVLGDLFPNDISIAITEKRQQMSKKCSSPEKMDDAGDSFSIDLQEQQLGF